MLGRTTGFPNVSADLLRKPLKLLDELRPAKVLRNDHLMTRAEMDPRRGQCNRAGEQPGCLGSARQPPRSDRTRSISRFKASAWSLTYICAIVDLPQPGGPFNKINRAMQPDYERNHGGKAIDSGERTLLRLARLTVRRRRSTSPAFSPANALTCRGSRLLPVDSEQSTARCRSLKWIDTD